MIMSKKKEATREEARRILKEGILDMSVERLIQMSQFGLCGNINTLVGICGTSHYFNKMNYIKAENDDEQDLIEYFFIANNEDDVIASTSICIAEIEDISGCINEDNPDDVLDINIDMTDGTIITINVIY